MRRKPRHTEVRLEEWVSPSGAVSLHTELRVRSWRKSGLRKGKCGPRAAGWGRRLRGEQRASPLAPEEASGLHAVVSECLCLLIPSCCPQIGSAVGYDGGKATSPLPELSYL